MHAGLEGQQLLLSAGVNQLRLNKLPVANPLLSERDHGHRLLAWVWLLAFVGIVLLLFRYRLRVRRQRHETHVIYYTDNGHHRPVGCALVALDIPATQRFGYRHGTLSTHGCRTPVGQRTAR